MSTVKYTVPNWSQEQLAKGAGLDPKKVVVSIENDHLISFLQHMPRKEFTVNKKTGAVLEH